MKSLLILTVILLNAFTSQAQYDTIYIHEGFKVSKGDSFTYYRVVPPISEDGRYHVIEYDKDNIISRELTYKTISLQDIAGLPHDILDGKYIQYDSTGGIKEEGKMAAGNREGKWTEYYVGTRNVRYEGNWVNDYKEGEFYNYYLSGKIKRKEIYKKGKLKKGYKYDEEGNKLKFTPYWQHSTPTVNIGQWLAQNIRYPLYEREHNIQGRVMVSFLISEDGSMTEIKALNNPGDGLVKEALRVVTSIPKWKPLIVDDIPQKIHYRQPINFRLQ